MNLDLPSLLTAARDSVQQPRSGARAVLNLNLPPSASWVGLVLMAVVSSGLSSVSFLLSDVSTDPMMDPAMVELFTNPIQLAVTQGVVLLLGAMLIFGIGRLFGGKGSFAQTLLLVAWLEFILLLLQIAQTVLLLLSPTLAAALGLFGLVLFLWLLTNFVAELHGYTSVIAVFFAIIGTVLVISFAVAVLIVASVGVGLKGMLDVNKLRADFPILSRQVNGKPLVYLDNGASAQKPQVVIDAVTQAYSMEYANVHRGLHYLSNLATDKYEAVRATVARFLNAESEEEIVFTTGATEGINLVSYAWAAPRFQPGDEIVLSVMEHHANIVPWHFLRERQGVVLKWVEIDANGDLDPQAVIDAIGPRTKLVAISHMSNVLGSVVDVKSICRGAAALGVPVLVDGSQAAVHMPVDVQDIGCDFYAITGHKLYGPSGSGAIFIRNSRMAEMRPFLGGGDMIREVTRDAVTYNDPPMKFEAGTPGIVQQIGMGVALNYLMDLGMANIAAQERVLRDYVSSRLAGLNWLKVQGNSATKGAIFSFTLDGPAHAHDISTVLDKRGIAVRAGTHCAMPLMQHLGVGATCRASFAMYNTAAEADALVSALELCHDLFG